ncbi:deoxyribodipyrimidine photolyase [Planctomyces sp. SCGC AG-212-M04]|nr:deoxyribodipyrimidine photolyase [Planctomyces sp. SCGC AG-212-M04]
MRRTRTDSTLLWFRQDLRLEDHPALCAAVERGTVIPVFVWSPDEDGRWAPGSASRWWLHQSLTRLEESLRQRQSRLIIRTGPTVTALLDLVEQTGATAVMWSRCYEPRAVLVDQKVQKDLRAKGVDTQSFSGALLFDPQGIRTKTGQPYQVFTPFWRRCVQDSPGQPERAPKTIPGPQRWPESLAVRDLGLEPMIDWAGGMRAAWQPGEAGAQARLKEFLKQGVEDYSRGRNLPAMDGTSRLSPHLHFGEISPRQAWAAVQKRRQSMGRSEDDERFLTELGWREFAHHLLVHFPQTTEAPLRKEFSRFPWNDDQRLLRAWQQGATGYPIVDAGMRQLWTTGWMHNRVRMIVASFLTKDLLIPWQSGAEWFWDTLVDADLANNTLGWQWTAGCGADAAPFFRIFNPVSQGERFDPEGVYVRQWAPELAGLPDRWIHRPWEAPASVLDDAGVTLGVTYPHPIVDHGEARARALEAFRGLAGAES